MKTTTATRLGEWRCALKRSAIGRPCGHYISRPSEPPTARLSGTLSMTFVTLLSEAKGFHSWRKSETRFSDT